MALAAIVLFGLSAKASHILGGEISVQWINADTFRVSMFFYRDCNSSVGFPVQPIIGIYDRQTNVNFSCDTLYMDSTSITILPIGDSCYKDTGICVQRGVFTNKIVIPANPHGYYISYSLSARSALITNIQDPGNSGFTWYASIPDPFFHNSTPAISKLPRSYFCVNYPNRDTLTADDVDGDSLVYSLTTPYDSKYLPCENNFANYPAILWQPPYSAFNMIGGYPAMAIDPHTGVITAKPDVLGVFVFCVKVQEFTRGPNPVKLGEIRRDIQYSVLNCHFTQPVFSNGIDSLEHAYSIKAGDTLSLNIQVVDTPTVHLTLEGVSALFTNGSKTFFQQPVTGFGSVQSNFRYIPSCTDTGVQRVTFRTIKQNCLKLDTVDYNVDITVTPADPPLFNAPFTFTRQTADSIFTLLVNQGDSITVYPSDVLNGIVKVTDANPENTLTLSCQSELIGNGATCNTVTGLSSLESTFNFISSCKNIRDDPYHVSFIAQQCYQESRFEFDILLKPPVFDPVPNVFTPNGDKKNDFFELKDPPVKYDCGFNIKIYNRWGELMYEHSDPAFKWDGTNKSGSKTAEGVYYYIIEGFIGDNEYKRRGTIYLKL